MLGAFFLDGRGQRRPNSFAAAPMAPATGRLFARAVKLIAGWSFAFGAVATALFVLFGSPLIDLMTASPRGAARRARLPMARRAGAGLRRDGLLL